jgi:release factor glutamine methyltransferase
MLPTPSTSHVCFDNVYEPAEDSFLLLDTLSTEAETSFLREQFPPRKPSPLVVEVGTGSGVVLAFVTAHAEALLGRSDALTIATDINAFAARAATLTIEKARQDVSDKAATARFGDAVLTDLTGSLRNGVVDLLIFNPPYVPTEESPNQVRQDVAGLPVVKNSTDVFERDSKLLALSYAGGEKGMETTNRLLNSLPELLNPVRGVAYILLCAQNIPAEVTQRIQSWGPEWNVTVAGHSGKKGGWEVLQILRIWRRKDMLG